MAYVSCPRCKTTVEKPAQGSPVCPKCGFGNPGGAAPPQAAQPAQGRPAFSGPPAHARAPGQQRKGLAVSSMVLGIIGIVFLCVPMIGGFVSLASGLIATVLGGVALSKMKNDPTVGGKGMAIAGLVMGIIVLALALLVILVIGALFAAVGAV